jgi:hypothetical protein
LFHTLAKQPTIAATGSAPLRREIRAQPGSQP